MVTFSWRSRLLRVYNHHFPTGPMNDSPALSPGARMLKSVDEGFFKFEKFLNFLAALVILGIMLIGTFQVFGRKLLSMPVPNAFDSRILWEPWTLLPPTEK